MAEQAEKISCEGCGALFWAAEGGIEEESGMWLCPLCLAEEESCGCAGEDDGDY